MHATPLSFSCALLWRIILSTGALTLPACTENDAHVQELRQLREKLAAAEKKLAVLLETAQQVPATAAENPQELTQAKEKLVAAEERIVALENKLQETQKAVQTAQNIAVGNAESFKELAQVMEGDLLAKVGELRKKLGQTIPSSNLLDTTVKRLRPLEKIVTAYDSEIVFKVADTTGKTIDMPFKVQPGPDGQWRLPAHGLVQQQIIAYINRAGSQPPGAAYHDVHQPRDLPLPPGTKQKSQQNSRIEQIGADTPIIRWDGVPLPSKNPAPPPRSLPAVPPQTAAVPLAPKPPAAAPRVPALVMPVQQDVQVRFE